jgi:hypothetical protein
MEGLFNKYVVKKAGGEPTDEDAMYFVLRLDTDRCARQAAMYYGSCVGVENPQLFADLSDLIIRLEDEDRSAK